MLVLQYSISVLCVLFETFLFTNTLTLLYYSLCQNQKSINLTKILYIYKKKTFLLKRAESKVLGYIRTEKTTWPLSPQSEWLPLSQYVLSVQSAVWCSVPSLAFARCHVWPLSAGSPKRKQARDTVLQGARGYSRSCVMQPSLPVI